MDNSSTRSKKGYVTLPTCKNNPDSLDSAGQPSNKLRYTILGLTLLVTWLASLLFAYQMGSVSTSKPAYTYDDFDDRVRECGSTSDEARARGCQWDPVSFAWLPERCLDRELAEELMANNWTIHADVAGTTVQSEEVFSTGAETYLSNAMHAMHCIYSWKRLHRLLLSGRPYHSGLSYDHTKHCSEVLYNAIFEDPQHIKTRALAIYPSC